MRQRERVNVYLCGLAGGLFVSALLASYGHANWNVCFATGWIAYGVALLVRP